MLKFRTFLYNSIAVIFLAAMFFSCGNEYREVQDFLAVKNLPIGKANAIFLIHTDSGRVMTKLTTPLMYDYSNRKEHPYTEFPEGMTIVNFDKNGDSVTIKADYAITFSKTNISEARKNVVITNHTDRTILKTDQLFWDGNVHYIYTEKNFMLITDKDTLYGKGFEAKEDLTKVNMKKVYGTVMVTEDEQKN